VLPAMRSARTGRVITVTSLNGVVALPFSDAYNAAKFAVEGLMESLATVMREFGAYISVLEPRPVRTAFFANVGGHVDNTSDDDPYGELLNRFNRRMAALGSSGQSADSVAEVICEIAAGPSPALRYQSSEESRAIDAVREHAYGWSACGKCAAMRRDVDAEGTTRQDSYSLLNQICCQICGNAVSVRRCCPRPYDRDRAFHQVSEMSRTAKPQTKRLAAAPLDGFGMSKIIKPGRPLVVAGNDEACRRRFGQSLEHIDPDLCCALGNRLAQHTLNDLCPGTFGAQVLN